IVTYHIISFIFSSRRRNTRFSRDWSSDVCSSDLHPTWHSRERGDQCRAVFSTALGHVGPATTLAVDLAGNVAQQLARLYPAQRRSEKRRVGKECRTHRSL